MRTIGDFLNDDHREGLEYGRELYNQMVRVYAPGESRDDRPLPFDSAGCELLAEALILSRQFNRDKPEEFGVSAKGKTLLMLWSMMMCKLAAAAVSTSLRRRACVIVGERKIIHRDAEDSTLAKGVILDQQALLPWVAVPKFLSSRGEEKINKVPLVVDPFGALIREAAGEADMPDVFLLGVTRPRMMIVAQYEADIYATARWTEAWARHEVLRNFADDFLRTRCARFRARRREEEADS